MTSDLTQVTGIGPAAAAILKTHGFQTIEDLASASPANIMVVPGFGESRANQVITSAKAILSGSGGTNAAKSAKKESAEDTKKKKGKKKKDKSKKKKEKSKKKKGGGKKGKRGKKKNKKKK